MTPRSASSSRICWLIAAGVTASSAAALAKLAWRAAASNARSEFNGGSRRLMLKAKLSLSYGPECIV